MTPAAVWVLFLVIAATVLFVTEKLAADLVGLLVLGALLATAVLSPADAFAGFSNSATVTVAAMFVLSSGLYRTGALGFAGRGLANVAKRSQWGALALLLLSAGVSSAFLNNTAVMAIFLPVALDVARFARLSPSRLLMPLSYAIICGGLCTVIGSSSNLVVSGVAERSGLPAFGIFEIAPAGAAALGACILYLLTIGIRLLPERRESAELSESYGMKDYLTEIYLTDTAQLETLHAFGVQILAVYRAKKWLPENTTPQAGDQLRVSCGVEGLQMLRESKGFDLRPDAKLGEGTENVRLVEAVVAPGSELDGESLKSTQFYERFGAKVLAVRHHGQVIHEKISQQTLRGGDTLLLEADENELGRLSRRSGFILVSSVDALPTRPGKRLLSALIVLAVIACAALELAPMVVAATLGSLALVITRCITLPEAYEAIDWKVIFLLGSVTALGLALEKTGATAVIAKAMVSSLGAWGPVAVLAGIIALTALLTETMSNNAVAALVAPLAIVAAKSLNVDPKPFLFAVTYACSLCFILPAGYQTHMMIFEPGQYRTTDFVRLGGPLKVLLCVLFIMIIPLFWPLK